MVSSETMNFKKVFEALVSFFEERRIDYALIGAFALMAYGYARFTRDVDFVVRKENKEHIIAFVESLGYETIYKSEGFSNHVHPISSLGRIDFVYVGESSADKIFSEVRRLKLFKNINLPVASPEHIVALKVFAIKNDPQRFHSEMADIKALMDMKIVNEDTVKRYFKKWNLVDVLDVNGVKKNGY